MAIFSCHTSHLSHTAEELQGVFEALSIEQGDRYPGKSIRHLLMGGSSLTPFPLDQLTTHRGFLTAWWKGDRKVEAWTGAVIVAALGMALSAHGIEVVKDWAKFLAMLPAAMNPNADLPVGMLYDTMTQWAATNAKQIGILAVESFALKTMHLRWRGWMDEQMTSHMTGKRGSLMHLMNYANQQKIDIPAPEGEVENAKPRWKLTQKFAAANEYCKDKFMSMLPPVLKTNGSDVMIDNIDQRKNECIMGATGGSLGLARGAALAASTLLFSTFELWKMSKPVDMLGLGVFGQYGTLALTFGVCAGCIAIGYPITNQMGRLVGFINNQKMATEGDYRSHTNNILRKANVIAANDGNEILREVNKGIYKNVSQTWGWYNVIHSGFTLVRDLYNTFSRAASYIPALPSGLAKQMSYEQYIATTGMVANILNSLEWGIDVKPAWVDCKKKIERATDIFKAIQKIDDLETHYKAKGISEFHCLPQDKALGYLINNLQIMPEGHDAQPFARARQLRFLPGEWTAIVGPSGAGKSCLMKVVAGDYQWPYGRAEIRHGLDTKPFYAAQETEFDKVTLKQIVTHPNLESQHSDLEVSMLLETVGLGKFADRLADKRYQDGDWNKLSGGQKQMLLCARAILHKDNIEMLLLDEPGSALDPESKKRMYALMKQHFGDKTVLWIMHDENLPRAEDKSHYFDNVLSFREGRIRSLSAEEYQTGKVLPAWMKRKAEGTSGLTFARSTILSGAFQGPPVQ